MSLKKLHAGEGYTYLTRQVATGDSRRSRGEPMVDYYTAHGLPAGQWFGKGAAQLGVSGEVSEEQMRAAYGEFLHPDADEKLKALLSEGVKPEQALRKVRLGAKPYDFNRDIPFMAKRKQALEDFTLANRRVATEDEREAIELKIAKEMLPDEVVGSPQAARALVANAKRMARYPVSGYDLVFTPMKSVSVLWGIGDEETRKAIMAAHSQAVDESLRWVEDNALYTRAGKDGVRKLDCAGMTAAKFVHWDNRAGDPNLHTHCAVLNRVYSEGKYRTIDGTVLYRAAVTASEHYNARLKDLVQERLGVCFEQVEKSRGARKVWEISAIPDALMESFSRRSEVTERARELVEEYRQTYHREPPKSAQWKIMEQANLQTRGKKAEAKSLKELVDGWRAQSDTLSAAFSRESVLADVDQLKGQHVPVWYDRDADADGVVERVVDTVSSENSTWTELNLESEIHRELSHFRFDSYEARQQEVHRLVTEAAYGHCISVDQRDFSRLGPRRKDGESVFYAHGSRRFTNQAVLDAEDRLHAASRQWVVNLHTEEHFQSVVDELEESKNIRLSDDQQAFVKHLLFSPSRLAVGIGAAGTGKTTAMEAFARAWEQSGNRVVAFAPSAKAAEVLQESIGVETRTLASGRVSGLSGKDAPELGEGDVVLIDEAGMASTRDLDAVVEKAREVGASVRMVGDPQQLAAVETGGMMDELAARTDAPMLSEVRRFTDTEEADISLRLRDGDTSVIDWYERNGRVVSGLSEELPLRVFSDWVASRRAGHTALMIAGDRKTVATLNDMARQMFITDGIVDPGAGEADLFAGEKAAVGDVIVTRKNESRIRYGYGKKKRVKNGDLWNVAEVHDDGSLTVRHQDSGNEVVLPGEYVRDNCELGYASTVHRSQGMTVDEAMLVTTPQMDRQGFYVGMTRGKRLNRAYVADDFLPDLDEHTDQLQAPSARDVLERIINHDGRAVTAHAALEDGQRSVDVDTARACYHELAISVARPVWQAACPDEDTRRLLDDDPQTARLTHTIAALDRKNVDTETILSDAIATAKTRYDEEAANQDDGVEPGSLAFYVRMAIEDNHAIDDGESLVDLAGMPGLPHRREALVDAQTYQLAESARNMLTRYMAEAGDKAIADIPEWARVVGDDSDDPAHHVAWTRAVRALAAARVAGTVVDGDVESAPQPVQKLVGAARAAGAMDPGDRDDRMDLREMEKARETCEGDKQRAEDARSEWLQRAQRAREEGTHQRQVMDDQDTARQIAATDQTLRQARQQHATATEELEQAEQAVAAARSSFIVGRKDRVAVAEDNAATYRDRVEQTARQVAEADEAVASFGVDPGEWDRWVALAGNTSEWDRRIKSAQAEDEQDAAYAEDRAQQCAEEARTWEKRIDQIRKLEDKSQPAPPEVRDFYLAQMREILKKRKKPATKSKLLGGIDPNPFGHGDEIPKKDTPGQSLVEKLGMDGPPDLTKQKPGPGSTAPDNESPQRPATRSPKPPQQQ